MSIRSAVLAAIQQLAADNEKRLPPLADDLSIDDLGLDSLAIATIVARLEETLGFDPFAGDVTYPLTVGDFIRLYETGSRSREVDPGLA